MKKIRIALAAVALGGMLAACGSSADNGSDDGVASLGSTTTSPDADGQTTKASVDPEEALLAYTKCMRDEGIDIPDPKISKDGKDGMVVDQGGGDGNDGGPAIDPESEEFKAATKKCKPFMDQATGSTKVDPKQQAETREQMLEYAQCMRDQGIDYPDPEFTNDGGITIKQKGDGEPTDAERDAMDAANKVCAKDSGPTTNGAAPAGGQDD